MYIMDRISNTYESINSILPFQKFMKIHLTNFIDNNSVRNMSTTQLIDKLKKFGEEMFDVGNKGSTVAKHALGKYFELCRFSIF